MPSIQNMTSGDLLIKDIRVAVPANSTVDITEQQMQVSKDLGAMLLRGWLKKVFRVVWQKSAPMKPPSVPDVQVTPVEVPVEPSVGGVSAAEYQSIQLQLQNMQNQMSDLVRILQDNTVARTGPVVGEDKRSLTTPEDMPIFLSDPNAHKSVVKPKVEKKSDTSASSTIDKLRMMRQQANENNKDAES